MTTIRERAVKAQQMLLEEKNEKIQQQISSLRAHLRARDSAAPVGLGYITWTSRYLLGYDTAPTPYPFGGPLEDLKIIFVAPA